jgi:hypothetical protein
MLVNGLSDTGGDVRYGGACVEMSAVDCVAQVLMSVSKAVRQ